MPYEHDSELVNKSFIGVLSNSALKMILILGGYMKGHLISPLRKAAKYRKGFLIVILISDIQ